MGHPQRLVVSAVPRAPGAEAGARQHVLDRIHLQGGVPKSLMVVGARVAWLVIFYPQCIGSREQSLGRSVQEVGPGQVELTYIVQVDPRGHIPGVW